MGSRDHVEGVAFCQASAVEGVRGSYVTDRQGTC